MCVFVYVCVFACECASVRVCACAHVRACIPHHVQLTDERARARELEERNERLDGELEAKLKRREAAVNGSALGAWAAALDTCDLSASV